MIDNMVVRTLRYGCRSSPPCQTCPLMLGEVIMMQTCREHDWMLRFGGRADNHAFISRPMQTKPTYDPEATVSPLLAQPE